MLNEATENFLRQGNAEIETENEWACNQQDKLGNSLTKRVLFELCFGLGELSL